MNPSLEVWGRLREEKLDGWAPRWLAADRARYADAARQVETLSLLRGVADDIPAQRYEAALGTLLADRMTSGLEGAAYLRKVYNTTPAHFAAALKRHGGSEAEQIRFLEMAANPPSPSRRGEREMEYLTARRTMEALSCGPGAEQDAARRLKEAGSPLLETFEKARGAKASPRALLGSILPEERTTASLEPDADRFSRNFEAEMGRLFGLPSEPRPEIAGDFRRAPAQSPTPKPFRDQVRNP
ncbi:MAG: hypothetical protein PW734_09575 [Verrucomicrobium sp.]|nr:hypothetical protein [Verrucomicrobium sp.]